MRNKYTFLNAEQTMYTTLDPKSFYADGTGYMYFHEYTKLLSQMINH